MPGKGPQPGGEGQRWAERESGMASSWLFLFPLAKLWDLPGIRGRS